MPGRGGEASDRDEGRRARTNVTLEDVARVAGVHYSTVSRALDPTKVWRVNVSTRKHVQAVARDHAAAHRNGGRQVVGAGVHQACGRLRWKSVAV